VCILFCAFRAHADYDWVVAANRDEFLARPTRPAGFHLTPDVLSGLDVRAGGTWLGVTRAGRFAAVTNVREPARHQANPLSRGQLVVNCLVDPAPTPPSALVARVTGSAYDGFNLLVGDRNELVYTTNRAHGAHALDPGVYGVSNARLDLPWPKVDRGRDAFEAAIEDRGDALVARLLAVLADTRPADDASLPDTGVGLANERWLSPLFVRSPDGSYGTRSSTVALCARGGDIRFVERTYEDARPDAFTDRAFNIAIA
jgi:uncharacterized protein with NRDE domain